MNLITLLAYLVGTGGLGGAIVAISQAQSTKRKINADAAQILVQTSLQLSTPLAAQIDYLEHRVRELQELLDTERRRSQTRIDLLETQLYNIQQKRGQDG